MRPRLRPSRSPLQLLRLVQRYLKKGRFVQRFRRLEPDFESDSSPFGYPPGSNVAVTSATGKARKNQSERREADKRGSIPARFAAK